MNPEPFSEEQLSDLFEQAARAIRADDGDRWVVTAEFAPRPGDPMLSVADVDSLVEALREWQPAALFSPDRYALQLHVRDVEPLGALGQAFSAHDAAVRNRALRAPKLVRSEILTLAEFEKDMDTAQLRGESSD